ncbi:hypothetical protein [Flavonifractor sp. AGMB03687]|uniref:hypothetical protein n=1 Tax=Flavonifractor sp. AGMB03687 TaxID=2785133 RepID=UPI001ADF11CC|nr:hypothetical protein [Flavonifractor sp. AGMB03687]
MRKRTWTAGIAVLMLLLMCCTPALALDESEVESAIAASSNEAVAGNIFIWFLCAVAFLKISQKIDSFLAALGINVGRTGGSMLGELLIAGRAVGSAVGGLGGAVGNIFNRNHASGSSTTHQAAGQAFSGSGGGLLAVAKRAAGNAAASSATGTAGGVGSVIGGAMFGSSMASGGKFANSVIGAVATGDISSVGSIKGEKAAQALTSYLGYSGAPVGAGDPVSTAAGAVVGNEVVSAMDGEDQDTVTLTGGAAAGAQVPQEGNGGCVPGKPPILGNTDVDVGSPYTSAGSVPETGPIPTEPPTFRDVEIGGGRITGYETPAGGTERQFAMYNANQYMAPTGPYETVQTVDGESWYKQYAQPRPSF